MTTGILKCHRLLTNPLFFALLLGHHLIGELILGLFGEKSVPHHVPSSFFLTLAKGSMVQRFSHKKYRVFSQYIK